MAESYSVKAVLSAHDNGFSSTLKKALGATASLSKKLTGSFNFGFIAGAGQAAFSAVTRGVSGLVSEIGSSNAAWKTFEGNMGIIEKNGGKLEKSTAAVKKELQDFAQQTVYSASDMANTYAQLAAVGTKNTEQLVKGFGGLASAAENPQQAMKTLSQQATQMAAKPTVAWADFKLMLEQTPAGMAAVASAMGMTSAELVTAIQEGEVKTSDFLNTIADVGGAADSEFQKLAKQPKTVGQAMDGLTETLGNKLTPAFDYLSKIGIKAVEGISDKLEGIDAQKLQKKLMGAVETVKEFYNTFKTSFSGVRDTVLDALGAVGGALGITNGEFSKTDALDTFKSACDTAANAIKAIAGFIKEHSETIAKIAPIVGKIALAFLALKVVNTVAPGLTSFIGSLLLMAGKGIAGLAGKLFGISKGQKSVGEASASSSANMLTSAKAYALMGVAVLAIAVGFALLAQASIALANSGGLAIGVMAGMVILVAALGFGMGLLMKFLAPMAPQLMSVATAMLVMGAAVVVIAVGFALLAQTSIALANSGGLAIGVMAGLVVALAGLMALAAALAPAMTAGAVGFIAFGAAIALVGAGALMAAAALAIVAGVLPTIVSYGAQGASAIALLGTSMMVFAAGAALAGAAAVVLGVGFVGATVGVAAFGVAMAAAAVGAAAMAVALLGVTAEMKSISKNAKSAEKSLKSMEKTVGVVEGGLKALGELAESAMDKIKSAFDKTAKKSNKSGLDVGTNFAKGLQTGLILAVPVASSGVTAVNVALSNGRAMAYRSGAFLSQGFAQGMLSQLSVIRSAANQMAAAADRAVQAKLKIHSPSKVGEKSGEYYGAGIENGIVAKAKDVWNAAQELFSIPQVSTPRLAMSYAGEMSGDFEYYRNSAYTIVVPLDVDGREVARATATYTQEELDKRQMRDSRKHGKV